MTTKPWIIRGAGRLGSALALSAAAWLTAMTPISARSQGKADAPMLTLPQAFAAAWPRQPEARSADARRQAAQAQAAAARSWTVEPIALELSARSDRLAANRGEREYEIGVAVPLWLPGERSRAQALAEAERAAVDSRIDGARLRLAGALREAWWAMQPAALETTLAEARLANALQLAADVARRVKAGDLSRADLLQAEGAVAAAQSALAETQAAQAQAQQALRALTGIAPADVLSSASEAAPDPGADAGRAHPALRELDTRADLARRARGLSSVQTRANPELTLSTTRERGIGEPYNQSLTLALRIPFGSDDRQRARLATAGAEQAEAESQLELERARVAADIAAAQLRADASQRVVAAADRRAALAAQTRLLFEKSFRLGETDLPTRLRVELEAFEAERQRERSRLDLAHAISQWRQALGLLPE